MGGSLKKDGLQLGGVFGQWGGSLFTVDWKMRGSSVVVGQTFDRNCDGFLALYINNVLDTMSWEARGREIRRGKVRGNAILRDSL